MPSENKTILVTPRFRVTEVAWQTGSGIELTRPVIRHPGAVVIIPIVDDDHVCLIHNYRVAVDSTLVELPAGTLEKDEPPEQTAHRELIEETGYRAEHVELLHTFYMSPGILDERMYLFVARGLDQVGAAREANEEIENLVVTWQTALAMVHNGHVQDAKTLVGLLYYDRLRTNDS